MTAHLLILADRAQMKTFLVDFSAGRAPVPRLIDRLDIEEARGRWSDESTDAAGAFPTGGTGGQGNSIAEKMSVTAENELRCLRKIAAHLAETIRAQQPGRWSFAAPSEINGAILDGLPDACRKTLALNLAKDLVNVPADELLRHFQR